MNNDKIRKAEKLRQNIRILVQEMKGEQWKGADLLLEDLHSMRGRFMQIAQMNNLSQDWQHCDEQA